MRLMGHVREVFQACRFEQHTENAKPEGKRLKTWHSFSDAMAGLRRIRKTENRILNLVDDGAGARLELYEIKKAKRARAAETNG